ncbi:MAG TPA: hypothetical protein VFJ16_09195 [Longimicrobium sp.]|nr:hypothetical protein [Longimicrobium sp.]
MILLTACGRAAPRAAEGPPWDDSPVQTDSPVYTLRRTSNMLDATATLRYVNRTGRPVHYLRCSPRRPEPLHSIVRAAPDTARIPLGVGVVRACAAGPTGVLAPGDSVVMRVWIGSIDQREPDPRYTLRHRTGYMRILLDLCEGPARFSDCTLLPEAQRRSNRFRVVPPSEQP